MAGRYSSDQTMIESSRIPRHHARLIGLWLAVWAGLIALLILIGGATRLTESGLSITEWNPVSGVIPPLSQVQWEAAFEKYQQIPQYQAMNSGMSISDFKVIFLWEYSHRLMARLVGLVFALPLLWFLIKGIIPGTMRSRLIMLLILLALQGALGWFMVASGLSERTEVSQYRLAAHLFSALLIYGAAVWTAADFLSPPRGAPRGVRHSALLITGLATLTAVAGAFVAGLRAGKMYNTFPLMAGRLLPPRYGQMEPWWRNLFENHGAVQFNHRLLATLTALTALTLWYRWRKRADDDLIQKRFNWVAGAVLLQFGLGVATLLMFVPVSLGVIHQGGAVLLITCALLLAHASSHQPALSIEGE